MDLLHPQNAGGATDNNVVRPVRVRAVDQMVAQGILPSGSADALRAVERWYPVSVTQHLMQLIDPADPQDPIARQFVPQTAELDPSPFDLQDPIGDQTHSPTPGIIHRYPDRVLLNALSVCPAYCRFCFRRGRVGPRGGLLSQTDLDRALRYIETTPGIWEVILSGGDPLMLSDRRLRAIFDRLARIRHVKVLRLHSRVPIADPARITDRLIHSLRSAGKPVYVLVHCNHPRELSEAARAALARMADGGLSLLSQSVLLRGVNDDPVVLADLMRRFVECRIKPHYLHHPDLARGTAHFRLSLAEGRAIVGALRGHVSGLCQPTYVLDIPGGAGKAPLGPVRAIQTATGWEIEDFHGVRHPYPEET